MRDAERMLNAEVSEISGVDDEEDIIQHWVYDKFPEQGRFHHKYS